MNNCRLENFVFFLVVYRSSRVDDLINTIQEKRSFNIKFSSTETKKTGLASRSGQLIFKQNTINYLRTKYISGFAIVIR